MKLKQMKVKITFTEHMLGTKPATPEIFSRFVADKKSEAEAKAARKRGEEVKVDLPQDEIDAANAVLAEKGTTVFHRDADGTPILWDYQLKGFFKDACGSLRRAADTKSATLKAYKSVIDAMIFVAERKVRLVMPADGDIAICERPLRAETMQGPRVALSRSETVPAGTTCEFTIALFDDKFEPFVREWLDYGKFRGIGQWRNSGAGRFEWEEIG